MMTIKQARLDELERISNWLTDHGAENYLQYIHDRGAVVEAGDAS